MAEFDYFIDRAVNRIASLKIGSDVVDRVRNAEDRIRIEDLLLSAELPYTVDSSAVIAALHTDYLPGYEYYRGYERELVLEREDIGPQHYGDFSLILAVDREVFHAVAFTSSVPGPRCHVAQSRLQLAVKLPASRGREFVEVLSTKMWQPHLRSSLQNLTSQIPKVLPSPRVEVIHIGNEIVQPIGLDPDGLLRLGADGLEALVANRLREMGLGVHRVGKVNQKDGGVDIVAWPERSLTVPFLLAVQVKHSSVGSRVGPQPVRDLAGVLAQGKFHIGMLVTNTDFTVDAKWAATHGPHILRLRGNADLMRWIQSDFLGELAWREIPETIELAPGVRVSVPRSSFWMPDGA